MIKYKFAYNSLDQTIDVQTLSKENKTEKFRCLGCGHELVAVLGEKRVKHFRHKVSIEINCSPETYLHKLAKLRFYEVYQNCLANNEPFYIKLLTFPVCNFYKNDFLISCHLDSEKQEFDLSKYFKKISIECKEGAFVPDVLLEAENQEKMFFEVVVTHSSTQKKINSSYRIIEFIIKSEEEIKIIESHLLEQSETIRFINFKQIKRGNYCQGKCSKGIVPYEKTPLLYNIFIIYSNGKSAIVRQTLVEIELLQSKILHFEYVVLTENTDKGYLYRSKVVKSYQEGWEIKNCFLCRYHALNQSWTKEGTIFCKFLKKIGNSNMATNCQYFRADFQAFSQYLEPPQEED
jgi:hypothetical protein